MQTDLNIFKNILISIFLEAIPFVLLGVLLAALLQMFVSEQTVRRWMPKKPALGILFGTGLGLLFPICECGMIPVIRRLLQKGMPTYIAIVFVISGPILNPIVFFSTYMAFRAQPEMAYARMGLAFIVAVAVGWIILRTVKKSPLKHSLAQMAAGPEPAVVGVSAVEQVPMVGASFEQATVAPREVVQPLKVTIAARAEDDVAGWRVIGDDTESVRRVDVTEQQALTLNERLAGLDEEARAEPKSELEQEPKSEIDVVEQTDHQDTVDTRHGHEVVGAGSPAVTDSERDALIGWSAETKVEKDYAQVVSERASQAAERAKGFARSFANRFVERFVKRVFSIQTWEAVRGGVVRFEWSQKGSALLKHSSLEFFEMGKYLALGCVITAAVHTFVSRDVLVSIGDGAVGSHLFMMAFAYILSICSTSDAFVASSFAMTFSGGSLLAFLVFGPMMDFKTTLMMMAVFRAKFVFYLMMLLVVTVFVGSLIVGALVF